MVDGYRAFFDALTGHTDDRYQGSLADATMVVTRVEKDSTGAVLAAYGTLVGQGSTEFYMPMRGNSAGVGDRLLGTYPKNNPTGGELTYVRHVYSDNPSAGLLVPDANLPFPAWATTPLTTAMDASAGNITSYVVAHFLAVEARYNPASYTVLCRTGGGDWIPQTVNHTPGQIDVRLAPAFQPGAYVDVQLIANYSWAKETSLPSDIRTIQAAVDNISPGDASNLTWNVTVPGTLDLTPASTNINVHFDHWYYEIATSSGGAGLQSMTAPGRLQVPFPGGTYYARVTPISKSGTSGGMYPASGFVGPFTIVASQAILDTTPPPDWTAPTVTLVRYQERPMCTVTLPAYTYPPDYARTEARVTTNGAFVGIITILSGGTSGQMQVDFGTTSVTLVGYDKTGNFSNASPAGTAALGNNGAPGTAPTSFLATPFALAVQLTWVGVVGATGYEVWRAPDVSGVAGTYALVSTIDSLAWLDTIQGATTVQPKYWWQVRGVNSKGNGPFSVAATATMGVVDAANLRLNSVTAQQIAADQAIFNTITDNKILQFNGILRGGPAGANRIEMHGQYIDGTGNQNSLFALENVAGVDKIRMRLNGANLQYLNDSGAAAITFGATGGIGYMQSAGGFTIRGDYTDLSLNANQYMTWHMENYDGYDHSLYLTRARYPGIQQGIGFLTARHNLTTGGYDADPVIFGATTYPTHPTQNFDSSNFTAIQGGVIQFNGHLNGPAWWSPYTASASLDWNNSTGTLDALVAPLRIVNVDSAAGKLQHTGASGNFHQDWSNGTLYLGWFTNPGGQVIVGNGTSSGYGVIVASNVTVPSSQEIKSNIVDLGSVWSKVAQLKPRKYELKGRPGVTQYGFVAEEVAAIMPEIVPITPAAPYPGPVHPDLLPIPTPSLDLYGLITTVAAGVIEAVPPLVAGLATMQAQIADLTARLATVERKTSKLPVV